MTHNGVEMKSMTHNGEEVFNWIHNGVNIFSISQSFYWIKDSVVQDGFVDSYNTYSSNAGWNFQNKLTGLYIGTTSSTTSMQFIGYSETVNTKKNTFMEISVFMGSPSSSTPLSITFNDKDGNGDISTKITTSGTYTIDISHVDTITIWVNSYCHPESSSTINIQSLRFYS